MLGPITPKLGLGDKISAHSHYHGMSRANRTHYDFAKYSGGLDRRDLGAALTRHASARRRHELEL